MSMKPRGEHKIKYPNKAPTAYPADVVASLPIQFRLGAENAALVVRLVDDKLLPGGKPWVPVQ